MTVYDQRYLMNNLGDYPASLRCIRALYTWWCIEVNICVPVWYNALLYSVMYCILWQNLCCVLWYIHWFLLTCSVFDLTRWKNTSSYCNATPGIPWRNQHTLPNDSGHRSCYIMGMYAIKRISDLILFEFDIMSIS